MIKMIFECDNCHASGPVDPTNNDETCGICPNCHEHHGEVHYYCEMSVEDFLKELANMTESEMQKSIVAIQECARDLYENY